MSRRERIVTWLLVVVASLAFAWACDAPRTDGARFKRFYYEEVMDHSYLIHDKDNPDTCLLYLPNVPMQPWPCGSSR